VWRGPPARPTDPATAKDPRHLSAVDPSQRGEAVVLSAPVSHRLTVSLLVLGTDPGVAPTAAAAVLEVEDLPG